MYKVAVIGAGVVGAMVARRLAAYDMKIVILEKEADVAMGQSKANSGIVHAGYDPVPGSLKAKLNVEGNLLMEETCRELDVHFRRNGALVVAFNEEETEKLKELMERGRKNGVEGLQILTGDSVRKMEKNLSHKVKSALYAPTAGVVCPYELTIEAVGNAMDNGAELLRNFSVVSIGAGDNCYHIEADDGRKIKAQCVVNCAGLYSDKIAAMIGDDSFKITPRAGEYLLLDKEADYLTNATIFKVPDAMGKGVLATRTVDGNILLGPTSVDREDKEDAQVTAQGMETIREREQNFFDEIPFDKVITQFTGLRAHGDQGDFIINIPRKGFINVAGIESPGLTSAPAIGHMVEKMLLEEGLQADKKTDYNPCRPAKKRFRECTTEEKKMLIKENPLYGHIVCRCEEVTEGEIVDAIRRTPGAVDTDGVKRRTRSGMGRCQGGFCLPQVVEIISREMGIKPQEVTKKGGQSKILYGPVKGGEK